MGSCQERPKPFDIAGRGVIEGRARPARHLHVQSDPVLPFVGRAVISAVCPANTPQTLAPTRLQAMDVRTVAEPTLWAIWVQGADPEDRDWGMNTGKCPETGFPEEEALETRVTRAAKQQRACHTRAPPRYCPC